MSTFDYVGLSASAKLLIAQFASKLPCVIIRPVEAAPPDPTQPWRLTAPTSFNRFPFIALTTTLGFPRRSNPITDHDLDLLVSGDLISVASTTNPATLCGPPLEKDRVSVPLLGVTRYFTILGVQDITPADVTVIWKLRCQSEPAIVQESGTGF